MLQSFIYRRTIMKKAASLLFVALILASTAAFADEYVDTINLFKNTSQSASFFGNSYGYAVFPTIGKGAVGVGAAHGNGRVYSHGKYVGDTSMTQISVGLQLGGQAYSEMIFFKDKPAFDKFIAGNFELGADASAVAITAGANAKASTTGSGAGASSGKKDATAVGDYHDGAAIFTIVKGGAMYEAAVSGQKFSYKAR
jgi:lipid-binding SYLF domain-containing protein